MVRIKFDDLGLGITDDLRWRLDLKGLWKDVCDIYPFSFRCFFNSILLRMAKQRYGAYVD